MDFHTENDNKKLKGNLDSDTVPNFFEPTNELGLISPPFLVNSKSIFIRLADSN